MSQEPQEPKGTPQSENQGSQKPQEPQGYSAPQGNAYSYDPNLQANGCGYSPNGVSSSYSAPHCDYASAPNSGFGAAPNPNFGPAPYAYAPSNGWNASAPKQKSRGWIVGIVIVVAMRGTIA